MLCSFVNCFRICNCKRFCFYYTFS